VSFTECICNSGEAWGRCSRDCIYSADTGHNPKQRFLDNLGEFEVNPPKLSDVPPEEWDSTKQPPPGGCITSVMIGVDPSSQTLPSNSKERKGVPIATGFLDYFPLAVVEITKCSVKGNTQHSPGEKLHWARELSGDESDALMRHFMERGTVDSDGIRHSTKVAWRALAMLQKELEDA